MEDILVLAIVACIFSTADLCMPPAYRSVQPSGSNIAIYEGRTPCDDSFLQLNKMTADGCKRVKMRLTIYEDAKTQKPLSFELRMVYVGKGDVVYTTTGKCSVTNGYKENFTALLYRLEPEQTKLPLLLLKGDDNILFFMDNGMNLMVGNEHLSYTLSRVKKTAPDIK